MSPVDFMSPLEYGISEYIAALTGNSWDMMGVNTGQDKD